MSVMTDSTPRIDQQISAFVKAAGLIRAGEWKNGLEAADAVAESGEQPDDVVRLLLAIALVRSGAWEISQITPDLVEKGDQNDIRRLLLGPLIHTNSLDHAVLLLGAMIAAH